MSGFGSNSGFGSSNKSTGFGGNSGFGSNKSSGFGSNNNKSTGFGSNNNKSTGFGSNSTGFGANNKSTGFGSKSTGFGSNNKSTGFGNNKSSGFGSSNSSGFGSNKSSGFGSSNSSGFGSKSGGFGSKSTGFGSNKSTGFGSSNSGFGSSNQSTGFGSNSSFGNTGNSNMPVENHPIAIMGRIAQTYEPKTPNCNFSAIFYNLKDRVPPPDELRQYRPEHIHPQIWNNAIDSNPEPNRLQPVEVVGFKGLKERVEVQEKTLQEQLKKIEEAEKYIAHLKRKHELETMIKMEEYKQNHVELCHRVLQAKTKIELAQLRGFPMYPNEEKFHQKLENLQRELNKPTQFKGRLNELTSLVRMQDDTSEIDYENLDEQQIEMYYNCLKELQSGIQVINDSLKESSRDLDIAANTLNYD